MIGGTSSIYRLVLRTVLAFCEENCALRTIELQIHFRLQQITSSVHTFHLGVGEGGVAGALRRTPETRDRSAPRVDHHVAHVLAIHNYNQDRLQHVEPRVTSDVVVSDEAARGEEELASAPHR